MTGTKVVKLKLDGEGHEKLPKLMDDKVVVEAALGIYGGTKYQGEWGEIPKYHQEVMRKAGELNVNTIQLQKIIDILYGEFGGGKELDKKLGLFTTALIQASSHDKFSIKPPLPMSWLGFQLKGNKNITVEGDAWNWVGFEMEGGTLRIGGNVGDDLGWGMKGGRIEVGKEAGHNAGNQMEGGTIDVKEKIRSVSSLVKGGEIIIAGVKVRP
ncbi:MAG: hypothetical protein V1921_06260 [Candidatus Altiarchaeota archaeon]